MINTGEQYIPEISSKRLMDEHQERYRYAQGKAANKHVLDIACGTGYGTHALAEVATSAKGVDLDQRSIDYAMSHYSHPRVSFTCAAAEDVAFDDGAFDLICSFETIEHLTAAQRTAYLKNLQRMLSKSGTLLLSTPNKKVTSPFTDKPLNPFHIKEFTLDELVAELSVFFHVQKIMGQRLVPKWATFYLPRKAIRLLEIIRQKRYNLYDTPTDAIIKTFDAKKIEPRILVLECTHLIDPS